MVDEHWDRWAEDLAKIRLSTTTRMPFTGTLRPAHGSLLSGGKNELAAKKSAWVTALVKPAFLTSAHGRELQVHALVLAP